MIGIDVRGPDAASILEQIAEAERLGVGAAWLTMGIPGYDPLTLLAVAAAQTRRIRLGSAIIVSWSRHPVLAAQQARTIDALAPGRFRLGVGPSHEAGVRATYGEFRKPLTQLREWVSITRSLLESGAARLDGEFFSIDARVGSGGVLVPVMISALRPASWRAAGAWSDGGIAWVCPWTYLRDEALPALQAGAAAVGRPAPPLIAHVPVAVDTDRAAVRAALRQQLGFYPKAPFYQAMFLAAGFPEAAAGEWSDAMIDSLVVSGDEAAVTAELQRRRDEGAAELLCTIIRSGAEPDASAARTLRLLGSLGG